MKALISRKLLLIISFSLIFLSSAVYSAELSLDDLRKAAKAELNSADQSPGNTSEIEYSKADRNMIFSFFIMQVVLISVVLVLHTYTGMHIIKRGIIFCDLVLDQLAAFGIVLGIGLNIAYGTVGSYVLAMLAVLIGCVLLALIRPKNKLISTEAVIGVMYGLALVSCLLLADKLPTGGDDLKNTLIGSMSWVSIPLIAVTCGVYFVLIIFHYFLRKKFVHITDSNEEIKLRWFWDFLFFLAQGIITILIVPVAGVLLAYGFLMIPAAIGLLFTKKWLKGILIGWSSGMIACILGLIFSYKTDSPYGPSLMIAMGLFFIIALAVKMLKKGGVAI